MKTAVHFGAGNIGRGFIGLLLHKAGYEVVFADVVQGLVEQLDAAKGYRVLTLDDELGEEKVSNIRAVLLDSEACRKEIEHADIVTTAVGVGNLKSVAMIIADGLRLRQKSNVTTPLNVLACENAIRATSTLKQAVLALSDDSLQVWIEKNVGFADVAVDRIAPNREGYATEPLDSVVERFFEWDIERTGLKGELTIPGATFVEELDPYLERKLFMLNGAHVTAAYAGFHQQKATILDAMKVSEIASLVEQVQMEAAFGLAHRYSSLQLEGLKEYAKAVQARFLNPHIHDDVARVGRDPLRKLGPNDRLVSPLQLAQAANGETKALLQALAYGFHYDNPSDEASVQIQQDIKKSGLLETIERVTGIHDKSLVQAVADAYQALS